MNHEGKGWDLMKSLMMEKKKRGGEEEEREVERKGEKI
jgi:hypothetical protein